ncbi:MAG: PKD domain-containing protein, partial [Pedosphaera sp.]|nr:PKD domain-containing protein [Pedosphaera sp.]
MYDDQVDLREATTASPAGQVLNRLANSGKIATFPRAHKTLCLKNRHFFPSTEFSRAATAKTFAALALTLLAFGEPDASAQNPPAHSAAKLTDFNQIHRHFTNGTVQIIVMVAPPATLAQTDFGSRAALARLRPQIRKAQQDVLDALPAAHVKIGNRFDNIPGFVAEVSSNGLAALQAHANVLSIEPVMELEPHLAQGIALIHGMTYRSTYNGAGLAIAICDTGIDYNHVRLGGGGFPNSKVLGGYDYGDNDADPIPNTQAHGTCCAGIAAGDLGTVGDYIGGVAYGAKLYALKISSGTTGSASTAAMVSAWDWCVTHKNDNASYPIMVISTSFGGEQYFSACDSTTPSMTTAANNAVAAGITVLASSGNDGFCDSLAWPSCISSVISVGAVYDAAFGNYLPCVSSATCAAKISTAGCATGWYVNDTTAGDKVTAYANVASFLTLFAPGNDCYTLDISGAAGYSSGDYFANFGGTSAACPYAAGAVAQLQSAAKALTGNFLTPAAVKSLLLANGDNVTDTKVAITKPRVNLERAIQSLDTNIVASFTGSPTNGGVPLTVTFTNLSANATNYSWNFGDGKTSTNANPANTYTNAGTFTVTLTAVGPAGTNVLTRVNYIVVTNAPPAISTQPQNQNVNLGSNATFTVTATGTAPLGYQWRFNGTNLPGATASAYTRVNAQLADAGPYSVVITNVNGSVTSSVANLAVIVAPGVISVTGVPYSENFDSMGASGTTTPFGWYVGTGSGAISGTTVTAGTGSSSSGGNYNFGSSGSTDRALGSLASSAGARATEVRFINVSGLNIVSLTISYTGEQWRVGGNGSANNDLVLNYSTNGTSFTALGAGYNFNTPVDSGSSGALDGNAVANRDTGIGGTFSPAAAITNGQIFYLRWVDVDNTSSDHAMGIEDLTITFTLANPPPVIVTQPQSLAVNQGSNATFTVSATGTPPLGYQWRFNGANLAAATATALTITSAQSADAGSYTAVVTNSGGAATSAVATLTVNLPPVADFTAAPTNGAAPLAVTFTNLSANATDFAWNFGDGNTSTNANPLNTYSNAGTFTVTLTAIGAGGTNVFTRTNYITVTNYPPPVADFTADTTNGLAPLAVTFTNLSANATDFAWDFGDGNTSANANPLNTYSNAGSFTVTLTATGAGGTNALTRTNYITVTNYPPPVADFTADVTNGLAPLAVTFTNLSANATDFAWDFGDGNTSTNANPLNTYSNAGSFTVTLTAIGAGGTNALTRTNYITVTNYPPPLADFTADVTNGLAPLTVTFTNLSVNATGFAWDFGDGNTSTSANPLNTYSNAGSFTVTLTAVGAGGTNALTRTNYITVTNYPPPLADFTADVTNGLAPLTVTFTNLSVNATGFAWDFGDGNTSTSANPLNTYSNAGSFTVTLTAVGAGGTNALTRTNYITVTNY